MKRRREAYCLNCKMFCYVDDAGRCVECDRQILEPKKKPKKKK